MKTKTKQCTEDDRSGEENMNEEDLFCEKEGERGI
jgi:hypothetical protein